MNIWKKLTDAFDEASEIEEMKKKYAETYLLLRTKDKDDLVVLYKTFDGGYHHFIDENAMNVKIKHDTKYEIYCKFPERILFNHKNCAYEFVRLPNRQFRRGICKDNVCIQNPIRALYGQQLSNGYVNINHKIISSALKPQYPDNCKEAIYLLHNKAVCSIALNNKFMISLSFTKDPSNYYLWYSNKCIGIFSKDKFYIKNPVFKQEVLDNMRLFYPYQVELT